MDEPFEVGLAARRVDRRPVERELHQVRDLDALRRARSRHEIPVGPVGMAYADVPEAVNHALVGEDAVGGHELVEQQVELGHAGRS